MEIEQVQMSQISSQNMEMTFLSTRNLQFKAGKCLLPELLEQKAEEEVNYPQKQGPYSMRRAQEALFHTY